MREDPPTRNRVGRGFPPVQHQFKPGRSGNPHGRPRGSKNRAKMAKDGDGLTDSDRIAVEEAYRTVTSKDGKELSTLSAISRSMAREAVRGGRLHAKDFIDRVYRAEEKAQQKKERDFQTMLELRDLCERILRLKTRRGRTDLGFHPHPDDFIIDYDTMTWRMDGPLFETEGRQLDELLTDLDWCRRLIGRYRRKVAAAPNDEAAQVTLLDATDIFLTAYEDLPKRVRPKRLALWTAGRDVPLPASWTANARVG